MGQTIYIVWIEVSTQISLVLFIHGLKGLRTYVRGGITLLTLYIHFLYDKLLRFMVEEVGVVAYAPIPIWNHRRHLLSVLRPFRRGLRH